MPVPLSYLELPDENFVNDVPLLAGPADKEAFTLHPRRQLQVRQHLYTGIKKADAIQVVPMPELNYIKDQEFFSFLGFIVQ